MAFVLALAVAAGLCHVVLTRADATYLVPQPVPGGVSALATDTLSVSGLLRSPNGAPIPYVTVSIWVWNGSDWAHDPRTMVTSTTSDGSYAFAVSPGSYRVGFGVANGGIVTYDGHRPEYYRGARTLAEAATIEVTDTPAASIDATLHILPQIAGRVVERPSGSPLGHADVEVFVYNDASGSWVRHSSRMTDDDGTFSWRGEPGRYRLQFYKVGSSQGADWESVYYPGAKDPSDAEDIVVGMDETRELGDVSLWRMTMLRGVPRSSGPSRYVPWVATLELYETDGSDGWSLVASSAVQPGALEAGFRLSGSYEGVHRVVVKSNSTTYHDLGFPSGRNLSTAQDVTLSRGADYEFELPLEPVWGSLAGTVSVAPDGEPAGGRIVTLSLCRGLSDTIVTGCVATATTAPDGSFTFPSVEPNPDGYCNYALRVTDPEDYCSPRVAAGPAVSPGSVSVCNVDTFVWGRYTGVVLEQGTGRPCPGMKVTFTNWWSSSSRTVTTGFDGHFDSGRLLPGNTEDALPGTYYVLSVDDPAGTHQLATPSDVFTFPLRDAAVSNVLLEMAKVSKETALSLSTTARTCRWGASATLSGRLTNEMGGGVDGASLSSEYSLDNRTWQPLQTVSTDASGTFAFAVWPQRATYYRVKYAGAPYTLVGHTSSSVRVTPCVYLRTPLAPSKMSHSKYYTVYGYLKPRHASGSYPVRVYKYRKVAGTWKPYGYVKAKAYDYSTYTRYKVKMSLSKEGRWRLKACAPADSGHAETWSSGFDYVTVN